MTLNCVKLGRVVTFMKYLASVVSNISSKNFNSQIAIKFVESCRTVGKWAYEECISKNLPIFPFLFDLSLLNIKISRAYN